MSNLEREKGHIWLAAATARAHKVFGLRELETPPTGRGSTGGEGELGTNRENHFLTHQGLYLYLSSR